MALFDILLEEDETLLEFFGKKKEADPKEKLRDAVYDISKADAQVKSVMKKSAPKGEDPVDFATDEFAEYFQDKFNEIPEVDKTDDTVIITKDDKKVGVSVEDTEKAKYDKVGDLVADYGEFEAQVSANVFDAKKQKDSVKGFTDVLESNGFKILDSGVDAPDVLADAIDKAINGESSMAADGFWDVQIYIYSLNDKNTTALFKQVSDQLDEAFPKVMKIYEEVYGVKFPEPKKNIIELLTNEERLKEIQKMYQAYKNDPNSEEGKKFESIYSGKLDISLGAKEGNLSKLDAASRAKAYLFGRFEEQMKVFSSKISLLGNGAMTAAHIFCIHYIELSKTKKSFGTPPSKMRVAQKGDSYVLFTETVASSMKNESVYRFFENLI